jgi:LmbE family N-acetylglucosaminyl deacetylase
MINLGRQILCIILGWLCLFFCGCARRSTQTETGPILIVAPHPDDETLGVGGQIALLTDKGYDIQILILTDGSQLFVSRFGTESNPPPREISRRRKRETERTVAHLGGNPDQIRYFDFPDGKLSENIKEAANLVAETINHLDPLRVYVTSAFEYHPDHRAANDVVKLAYTQLKGEVPELWEFCVSPRPEFGPGTGSEELVEIDITPVLSRKTQAAGMFACHLEIVVEGQTEPIWENANQYLSPTERFLVTKGSRPNQ